MIVQKRDGAFLYSTSDLATIAYRMETWQPDVILYLVGTPQSLHFEQLFDVARRWGRVTGAWSEQVRLVHVAFGSVLGEDGKIFRTRAGGTVDLASLLDGAVAKALEIVTANDEGKPGGAELSAEERRRVAEAVGIGAIKYADLSHNRRYGKSAVFQTVENAGRLNLDYSLGKDGTLYLSGEYRRGDIFSSGFASLTNIAIADVATRDDAFDGGEFFAYRFDGRTVLGTFGYNRPLGARDAIDFSIRRVQSTPSNRPDFDEGGRLRYIVNQYSLLYLLRF